MSAVPALHLFAKTPVPGQVKTRLQPRCSAEQASRIATWCIERTVHLASSAWRGPVYLHVWPTTQHRLFHDLRQHSHIAVKRQVAGDLGAKMYAALELAYPGAVMGCDVPHCPPETLACAHQALCEGADVIGASRDGGYYFIGLIRPQRPLFETLNWGDDTVFLDTLSRAKELGIRFQQLPVLIDLDTWDDIEQVRRAFPPLHELLARILHQGGENDG
jgi:rSAM/selenodomain-associated transferase 1